MREWLLDGFRYDRWANRRWAPLAMGTLTEVGHPYSPNKIPEEPQARLESVFAHLVWAQRIWLERLGLVVASEGEGWLDALHKGWLAALREREPNEVVVYRNTKGVEFSRPVGEIAWHLINHGTYHRGQLREIAERAGLEAPETDFTLWRSETA